MYYNLDLNEFFKDEYKELNRSEGIGGSGLITGNQIINVFNDYKVNPKDNKEYIGLGDHEVIMNRMLKDMYGESSYYNKYLYELISIKYWNAPYAKIIMFYLPLLLTEKEFNNMCLLEEFYKEIFNKTDIQVAAFTFGSNVHEYGPEIQTTSNLSPILEYAKKRVDKKLVRKHFDKKVEIDTLKNN